MLELIYIHLICLSENSGDRFLELQLRIRSEQTRMFSLEDFIISPLLVAAGHQSVQSDLATCYANAVSEIIPGCLRYHFISCHLASPGTETDQMHISTLLNTNGSCIFCGLRISNKPSYNKIYTFLTF